jgi:DNA-binding CsgD family transcriptional regulator
VVNRDPASGLRGRRNECELLDQLLSDVRAGDSRVVVFQGEAGIGKTALLDYVAAKASGCRVMRVAGVESEMELAFAGVHQLCAPLMDRVQRLPRPQCDALRTAFGMIASDATDPFLVGLGVLSLLADGAEQQPLLCLVDDVQWLDEISAQLLAFVARRLLAESVAMVFAVREPATAPRLQGLPHRAVEGLRTADARALLAASTPAPIDDQVRDRFIAETHGNPLALLEFGRALSPGALAGGFAPPATEQLASQIEQSFVQRVQSLPPDTQLLLLTAAAESGGDGPLLRRAAGLLGLDADAAEPAEVAQLIEVGSQVRFRHPLARSAAYRAASLTDRRRAHSALAAATDPERDPDRRAWHRAHAADGPDDAVADDLERSADRARTRGGIAAAAAFLEQAAALTANPDLRSARALAAAQAKFDAAAPDAADALLASAELGPLTDLQRAQLARLRAQIVFSRRRGSDAPPILIDAAKRLEQLDARLSSETYLEALGAAIFAGRLAGDVGEREAAEAARAAPVGSQSRGLASVLVEAVAIRYTEDYASAVAPLKRALQEFLLEARRGAHEIMHWLWLACPVAPEPIAPEVWDDEAWHELAARAVEFAREAGALGVLPVALAYRAGVHVHAGEFATAATLIDEAESITAATGNPPLRYTSLLLVAWRGDEAHALTTIAAAVRDATARGEGRVLGLVGYVTAVLYNGLGRYTEALAGGQRGCEHDDLGFFSWSLVETVEAAVRVGDQQAAAGALVALEERTLTAGGDWALGILARSRALLSSGPEADALYREAIERLGHTRILVHCARAHLVYGEWLRREQRRSEAQDHLRIAHDMLDRIGAEAFADRARRELLATGERVRPHTAPAHAALTPQETQIARLASAGHTNSAIGSQLFISPRTVEYHLGKVFTKLGITTRRELRPALTRLDP